MWQVLDNFHCKKARLVLLSLAFFSGHAHAERLLWSLGPAAGTVTGDTYLFHIRQGSDLSNKVSAIRRQGFESAHGEHVSLHRFYSTRWTDFKVLWATYVKQSSLFIWGASSGESGEKYRIQPALTLGFVHQHKIENKATLTFYAMNTV